VHRACKGVTAGRSRSTLRGMDEPKRVFWSVEECSWVACPPVEVQLPVQRTEEPEPAVLTES
jgi:hypothetical protein